MRPREVRKNIFFRILAPNSYFIIYNLLNIGSIYLFTPACLHSNFILFFYDQLIFISEIIYNLLCPNLYAQVYYSPEFVLISVIALRRQKIIFILLNSFAWFLLKTRIESYAVSLIETHERIQDENEMFAQRILSTLNLNLHWKSSKALNIAF